MPRPGKDRATTRGDNDVTELTSTERDAEAWRLRQQRTSWVDIAKQLRFPDHTWVGCDAVLAVARGARQPIGDSTMTGMPAEYRAAARRWNQTLAG